MNDIAKAAQQLADTINRPDGKHYERGFWRMQNGTVIVPGPNGKKMRAGAPSSRWKNHGEDTYNLQKWSERQVLTGTICRIVADPGFVLPASVDDRDGKHVVDGMVLEAKREAGAMLAADRGTFGHLLNELDDLGEDWLNRVQTGHDLGIPTPLQKAIVEVWQELTEPFDFTHIEQTVVSETTGTAGTLDRVGVTRRDLTFTTPGGPVTVPAKTAIIVDEKTGKLTTDRNGSPNYWLGYCHQLYCYATGTPVTINPDDPDDAVYGDWGSNPPSLQHAVIAHIDIRKALETGILEGRLIYCDLTAGANLETVVQTIRAARRTQAFSVVTAEPDASANVNLDPGHVDHGTVIEWLDARIQILGETPEARNLLRQHWPTEIPTPRQGGLAPSQVDRIAGLLDRIETRIQAPFGANDPRTATAVRVNRKEKADK